VQLTVQDSYGASDTAFSDPFVIYDARDGFVTGGGWIDSIPGAYQPDAALRGRATFAFSARYKKKGANPAGTAEFHFNVADLKFQSNYYEWLILNQGQSHAQFKGVGWINGNSAPNGELYKFMIWAGDGEPDTFRIKIWWEAFDIQLTVYDNGFNQSIHGGSIVIHAAKKK
jgi:hypothetical protein